MTRRRDWPAALRPVPWWAQVAWGLLAPLRRKYRSEYRAMRRRMAEPENWRGISQAMARVRDGALSATSGRRFHTHTDADALCALVIEALAWWAVEERGQVQAIRDAERELLALHERIDAAVSELSAAIGRSAELCTRFGLQVNHPMWRDNLAEVIGEARRRFPRWGDEPEVKALDNFETRSWYSPRPGVLDLVLIARNIGANHTVASWGPLRGPDGTWLRPCETWVSATDTQSAQALNKGPGSGATKERPQVHQLMASLREIGQRNGWDEGTPGPLEFLTDDDLSTMCSVATGWENVPRLKKSDPFSLDNMRAHRAAFMAAISGR